MLYYLLALISGAALSTQVGINGKLLFYLKTPIFTAFISFLVGTIGLAVTYLATAYYGLQPIPTFSAISKTSLWMWLGGLLGAFYIFSTIFCSPKIGFASMFSLVVAGQILTAVLFDHFGVFGNPVHPIDPFRLVGILLLIASVYLIQTH